VSLRLIAIASGAGLLLAACQPAPMPPPASGSAPPQDAMAPSDVSSSGASPATTAPVLPPPELEPPEPIANDLGTPIADNWVGTWTGPEGTSLRLSKQEVGYELVITNLDGPREFHAVAVDQMLQFERDGVTETVRAADGATTGMKWLAGKHDCLLVKTGEGYCRD